MDTIAIQRLKFPLARWKPQARCRGVPGGFRRRLRRPTHHFSECFHQDVAELLGKRTEFEKCGTMPAGAQSLQRHVAKWQSHYQPYIDLVDRLTAEKFAPHTASYFSQIVVSGLSDTTPIQKLGDCQVCQRMRGWTSGPHTPALPQLIQSLIYFAGPKSSLDQGALCIALRRPHVPGRCSRACSTTKRLSSPHRCPLSAIRWRPFSTSRLLFMPRQIPGPRADMSSLESI